MEEKQDIFRAFTAKAMKRLQDKKTRKYRTLYVPSIDENIRIRNLDYQEILECLEIEDDGDPNKSDKYAIYLAMVEPSLKDVAAEMKEQGEIHEYLEVTDIFDLSEINPIATEIMKLSGVIGDKKVAVVNELKNS